MLVLAVVVVAVVVVVVAAAAAAAAAAAVLRVVAGYICRIEDAFANCLFTTRRRRGMTRPPPILFDANVDAVVDAVAVAPVGPSAATTNVALPCPAVVVVVSGSQPILGGKPISHMVPCMLTLNAPVLVLILSVRDDEEAAKEEEEKTVRAVHHMHNNTTTRENRNAPLLMLQQ